MTPRDRVLSALRGEEVDRTPVSSVTQVGIVEAMERVGIYWPDAHRDAEKMARLGTSLYQLAGLEAARVPFDITVQAEAFGCQIEGGKVDQTPAVKAPAFSSPDQMAVPGDFLSRGRIPIVLKAAGLLRKDHPDLPAIVGIEGAATVAGHLLGIENILKWTIKKRDSVTKAFDVTGKANAEYVKAALDAGADIICYVEPVASPELLPPRDFIALIKPKLQEISSLISRKGAVGVLHICGNVRLILREMADSGFQGLSIEEKVDITTAREIIGGKKPAIVGNISPAKVLLRGKPDEIRQEAKKILDAGVDVLAPGCGIAPHTPLENVRALVNAAK